MSSCVATDPSCLASNVMMGSKPPSPRKNMDTLRVDLVTARDVSRERTRMLNIAISTCKEATCLSLVQIRWLLNSFKVSIRNMSKNSRCKEQL